METASCCQMERFVLGSRCCDAGVVIQQLLYRCFKAHLSDVVLSDWFLSGFAICLSTASVV